MANAMGLGYELLTPEQMQERCPFLTTDGLIGGLWDPHDGDIDPSQLTQATPEQSYTCEIVINAGGYRAGEISELFGQYLPVVSMQHQYLVTESVPELEQHGSLIFVLFKTGKNRFDSRPIRKASHTTLG